MRAACFQFDVRPGDVAHNLSEAEAGVKEAVAHGCDLVVLPEMWPTSFPGQDDAGLLTPEQLVEWASATESALEREKQLTRTAPVIVCGSAMGRTSGLPTNRWHMIEGGEVRAAYDKVHLFTPTAENASFSAGDEPPAWVETRHGRLGGIVCYDLRFPEVSRHLFHAGVAHFP
jgi:predicted amidohydrolase